ncbi:hypothetical protein EUA06_12090 [Nocardioides glacieisoli]|uniref:Uncharacterized protein n=1 Tax=Nocardioides glacieisoli TaxID=1168730 RepID=A0A4V1RJV8_9ACTN|nr:hypothetical protein [Nocardioides glacieisoli]RYB90132.1 hypothetical protein EUA06_12090 [Nocardioides glacieisoli]
MTSPSRTDLREELAALAETQPFSPDAAAWDRGRRARRNSRVARGAAVLAVVAIVVGVGAIAVRPDRQSVAPADVPGGALPSRVDLRDADFGADFETDFAIGRASVALGGNGFVLVDAEDGRYHQFGELADVLALSPDGYRLAWWSGKDLEHDSIRIADLRTGEITDVAGTSESASVTSMTWAPDSARLRWNGWGEKGARVAAWIDTTGSTEDIDVERFGARGIPSPSFDVVALDSGEEVAAAPFERAPEPGGREAGIPVDRALPADLHPDGAVVTPVGWADEDTLVAIIDPPPSDVVERPRLALLTSPDRPESEWTYREFLPRLPPEATSFAVDLIPDLTGDPDQQLTRDFTVAASEDSSDGDRGPLIAGALLALLAGLAFIRMMQKRA